MNTDDTETNVDIDETNLEDFEAEFYGRTPTETQKEEVEEVVSETEDDSLATEEDDDEELEASPEEEEEDNDDEEEEEPEEDPKPRKNRKSAKERIEELVAKNRESERREAELIRRLEQLEALTNKEVNKSEDEVNVRQEQLSADAPNPDALDKEGQPVYPLGEFDPQYIRDLAKFTVAEETRKAKEEAAKEEEAKRIAQIQEDLTSQWIERVNEVEKEIPEIRNNIVRLTDTFKNIDEGYGDYLASVIMSSEFGPQMMNYLSQNIGEAQKIVASGPAAATLALGRLEARFISPTKPDDKRNTKLVSKATEPPEERARGRGGKFTVSPDTDDLDAFERVFYKN